MKLKSYIQTKAISTALLLFIAAIGYSQQTDASQGIPRANGWYANMFRFEFKPGKSDEGLTLLKTVLIPAFKKAGVNVTLMEDLMGTKDILMIIELKDGPDFYKYVVPAQDRKLFDELIKLAGSEQAADAQLDKFVDVLARQSQTLVFVHNP
jgi:hypothetical protein